VLRVRIGKVGGGGGVTLRPSLRMRALAALISRRQSLASALLSDLRMMASRQLSRTCFAGMASYSILVPLT